MIGAMARAPLALALVAMLAAAPPAAAEYYRWVDDRGGTHYAEGIDSVPERYRARATPLGYPARPAAPAAAPAAPPAAGEIRFTPGERIMVDARVNGGARVRLQLDTGADHTLISPRALVAAGVSLTHGTRVARLTGATGTDRAQIAVVDSLEVGGARVGRLPVIVYEMAGGGGDGLLGRDFLDRFNVTIDAGRGIVTLAPK
jgi:predicted aspartyl protease